MYKMYIIHETQLKTSLKVEQQDLNLIDMIRLIMSLNMN